MRLCILLTFALLLSACSNSPSAPSASAPTTSPHQFVGPIDTRPTVADLLQPKVEDQPIWGY